MLTDSYRLRLIGEGSLGESGLMATDIAPSTNPTIILLISTPGDATRNITLALHDYAISSPGYAVVPKARIGVQVYDGVSGARQQGGTLYTNLTGEIVVTATGPAIVEFNFPTRLMNESQGWQVTIKASDAATGIILVTYRR